MVWGQDARRVTPPSMTLQWYENSYCKNQQRHPLAHTYLFYQPSAQSPLIHRRPWRGQIISSLTAPARGALHRFSAGDLPKPSDSQVNVMIYARNTTVSATRTRNEIEETLQRYAPTASPTQPGATWPRSFSPWRTAASASSWSFPILRSSATTTTARPGSAATGPGGMPPAADDRKSEPARHRSHSPRCRPPERRVHVGNWRFAVAQRRRRAGTRPWAARATRPLHHRVTECASYRVDYWPVIVLEKLVVGEARFVRPDVAVRFL